MSRPDAHSGTGNRSVVLESDAGAGFRREIRKITLSRRQVSTFDSLKRL